MLLRRTELIGAFQQPGRCLEVGAGDRGAVTILIFIRLAVIEITEQIEAIDRPRGNRT